MHRTFELKLNTLANAKYQTKLSSCKVCQQIFMEFLKVKYCSNTHSDPTYYSQIKPLKIRYHAFSYKATLDDVIYELRVVVVCPFLKGQYEGMPHEQPTQMVTNVPFFTIGDLLDYLRQLWEIHTDYTHCHIGFIRSYAWIHFSIYLLNLIFNRSNRATVILML